MSNELSKGYFSSKYNKFKKSSDELLRGLKALGTEATNRDPWLIQILVQKSDTETKRLWSVKTAEKDFLTLKKFLEFLNVRALLNSGSEFFFIIENAINILGLKRYNDRLSLSGIRGIQAETTRGSVGLKIRSRFGEDQLTIKAYILNRVTFKIPVEKINIKKLDYLKGIPLADEDFSRPSKWVVILVSDCFFSILRNGRITGSKEQPITQSTIFGWVVAGKIQRNCKSPFMQSHLIRVENECNIDSTLQQFWQTEELPLKKIPLSEEEEFCENNFKATYKINDEGRFVVKLPIYRDINQLGNSRGGWQSPGYWQWKINLNPMQNLSGNIRILWKNMKNWVTHMCRLIKNYIDGKISFLPHHTVRRKDSITTKLRAVFDGSCKPPNSNSLNSALGVGQIL
ncbi:DUF1758 domain-containing protein [Trichonephila clavipes]|nr:DUF1758 domain-containing protein [Trichonephila clavipes]